MNPVDCVWAEKSLDSDNRSHYAIATLLNNALDHAEVGFIHRNGWEQLPKDSEGAFVVIHGEHLIGEVQQTLNEVNKLKWAIVCVIGDDPGRFPIMQFAGPRRKLWMQMCVPGRHDKVDRKLICGFPHDAQAHLMNYEAEKQKRPLAWSFAGQINNQNRRECVAQIRQINGGFLYQSPCFWNGLPRDEYYKVMASSKVIACPTGANTPDTLRVAEALEAGCVPIVEDRWPSGYGPASGVRTGYWKYALGEEPPFPTLTDWRHFPPLFDQAIREWPANRDRLQEWWSGYKQKMCRWLEEDIQAIR